MAISSSFMEVLWTSHGDLVKMSCKSHEGLKQIPWRSHGGIKKGLAGVSCRSHAMFHKGFLDISSIPPGVLRGSHGSCLELSLEPCGSIM